MSITGRSAVARSLAQSDAELGDIFVLGSDVYEELREKDAIPILNAIKEMQPVTPADVFTDTSHGYRHVLDSIDCLVLNGLVDVADDDVDEVTKTTPLVVGPDTIVVEPLITPLTDE